MNKNLNPGGIKNECSKVTKTNKRSNMRTGLFITKTVLNRKLELTLGMWQFCNQNIKRDSCIYYRTIQV